MVLVKSFYASPVSFIIFEMSLAKIFKNYIRIGSLIIDYCDVWDKAIQDFSKICPHPYISETT